MSCLNRIPQGINKECARALGKINNIIIAPATDAGFAIDVADVQASWTAKFSARTFWMPAKLNASEETSVQGATEIETANNNKYISFDKPPSMNVMIDTSALDMYEVRNVLRGGSYQFGLPHLMGK